MTQIQIVEYAPEDRLPCIDLLTKTFPGTSDESTFLWRFDSSSRESPLLICAKDGNKIVSFNSWLPWDFEHNGTKYIGYQSGESATDERYRGKGIWSRVLRYADQVAKARNVDFLFGFPSTMSYGAFYKAGYCPIGSFNFYIRIINPLSRSLIARTDHAFDDFPSPCLAERNKIVPVVDFNYFKWRYLDNPKTYDIVKYTNDGNQAVFIVKRSRYYNKRYKVGWNEGLLLDSQFSSLNEVFVTKAFDYLDRIYTRRVFNLRTFLNPNTARGKAIAKQFHIRIVSRFETLCIKLLNDNLDYNSFFDWNMWDILPHVIDES